MKELNEELKAGVLKRVYLLYGSEAYLRLQYLHRVADAAVPPEDTMNRTVFEGKGIREEEVIELAETCPMFSEHRLILLKNSGFFKNKAELLPDYLERLPEYLVLVFSEEEVDKRSKLFKAVREHGRVTEFPVQEERVLSVWAGKLFRNAGKRISRETLQAFLQETGSDMTHIALEADKLIWYTEGREEVTEADLHAVTGRNLENRIFDMVRAVSERDSGTAFSCYGDLLSLKEPPMRILYLIARQYRQLLLVKELSEKGRSDAEIASSAQLPSFAVRRVRALAAHYTKRQLAGTLSDLNRLEDDVKNGRIADRLSVEVALSKLCEKTA